jgi:hypothetical protein
MDAPWTPMVLLDPAMNLWRFGPRQYRSMQMPPARIAVLARALELTTLLDLTADGEHDQAAEAAACAAVPMNSARVPMDGVKCPTQLQIDEALVYFGIDMQGNKPVIDRNAPGTLGHCTHGEDRSGVVCACCQLAHGVPLVTALDDFRRGHRTLDGAWGEYWFVTSIIEFSLRIAASRP